MREMAATILLAVTALPSVASMVMTTGSFFRQTLPQQDDSDTELLTAEFFKCDRTDGCKYLATPKESQSVVQSLSQQPDASTWGNFTQIYEKQLDVEENIALRKVTKMSSTWDNKVRKFESSFAVDGSVSNRTWHWDGSLFACTHTLNNAPASWWVDFGGPAVVWRIIIYDRVDCCQDRHKDMEIRLGAKEEAGGNPLVAVNRGLAGPPNYTVVIELDTFPIGRFLFFEVNRPNAIISICEVVVNGKLLDNNGGGTATMPELIS